MDAPCVGVRNVGVSGLAVDPSASSTIYTAVNGFLTKTTDGGAHWADTGLGVLDWVDSLLIDPTAPSTLYARGGFFGGASAVYKSADAGGHWVPVFTAQRGSGVVQAVAIAPSRSSTLYVGQALVGVLKSVDGGTSWMPVNNGLNAVGPYVTALAVDPRSADILYAATSPTTNSIGAIFKSMDGAGKWRQVLGWVPFITSIAIDPNAPSTVYATSSDDSVLKSTDSGESWTVTYVPGGGAQALVIDGGSLSQIYAATRNGVFRSTDAAASWSSFNSDLPSVVSVWSIAIDRACSNIRSLRRRPQQRCR
jgi:photosystem II stability/assembly factor-like uncharacterized protein